MSKPHLVLTGVHRHYGQGESMVRVLEAADLTVNSGELVAMVAPEHAEKVLSAMHSTRYGENAVIIGQVAAAPVGRVLLKTPLGSTRVVDMLAGEMLPRIC